MLPYFPFAGPFDLKMGTSPLREGERIIECDAHYQQEISLKRKLLKDDHRYYYRSIADTMTAQWEVVDTVLASLSQSNPQQFVLCKEGTDWSWENKLLGEKIQFTFGEASTLPLTPLDWVGRQVQEDLILLNSDLILVAGQLCFPSGWDLDEKSGKHFLSIHEPLPDLMNPMIESANKFIERIPPSKSFQRNNWGIRVCDQLDLSSRHSESYRHRLNQTALEITNENIGHQLFIRIEHQTLSRLPLSGHVLFTIHTYQNRLDYEMTDLNRARQLYSFLYTVPEKLLDYKLMTPFIQPLRAYLKQVTATP